MIINNKIDIIINIHLIGLSIPRSVNIIINFLTEKGYLKNDKFGRLSVDKYPEFIETDIINVPIIGNVAYGNPMKGVSTTRGISPNLNPDFCFILFSCYFALNLKKVIK